MKRSLGLLLCALAAIASSEHRAAETPFEKQNELLLERLAQVHRLSAEQVQTVREIFAKSGFIGQGNPAVTRHPMRVEACEDALRASDRVYANAEFEKICGAAYMAPLYDPTQEGPEDAGACIDQFEFPDVPCAYPVVWVRAREAAQLCEALGKRLCDAHEWEGACAGRLTPPDYEFDLAREVDPATAIRRMREAHNRRQQPQKSWSYGSEHKAGICAAAGEKSAGCDGGGWSRCGSNTYPAGAFPECRSALGVYDLHGNAAEHMNLPLDPGQMASRGSRELGYTEMKGSWFIFDRYRAHEDWCRWRAPFWHGSRVTDPASHHNYHLGFRCCKTVTPRERPAEGPSSRSER